MNTTAVVTLAILVVLGLWALAAYNRLVRHRNEIGNAFAQIDVQLKRRYDLIPNLVDVAAQIRAARARHAGSRDRRAQRRQERQRGRRGQTDGRLRASPRWPAPKARWRA